MRRTQLTALGLAVLIGFGLLAHGCRPAQPPGLTSAAVPFTVRGSVHQVDVISAPVATGVELRRRGRVLQTAETDDLGGYLFRNVDAGGGYTVALRTKHHPESAPVRVLSADEVPPPSLYANQKLPADNLSPTSGYGYLTTRDGTTLSVQVVLPGPADKGPYPTVMEYSGYDPSSPTTSQPQFKLLAPLLGYAWVGVNIRGTGCSGGAYNFFENLQSLDGYDAIETIAAQPWSTGRVGMVGISFAGISQLFVARSRPPHLDAITPLSVIDDTWRGTLFPGGIYNDGFAKGWAQERLDQNKWPNPDAPTWVKTRIAGGDTTCADNMLLRGQNVDLQDQTNRHPFFSALDPQFRYDFPNGGDSLAPEAFVKDITAPTFIAGAWQDEQTGGHWADMLNRFAPTTKLRVVGQNGVHTESLDPAVLRRDDRVPRLLRRAEGADDPGDSTGDRARDLGLHHRCLRDSRCRRTGSNPPWTSPPHSMSSSPTRRWRSTGRSARRPVPRPARPSRPRRPDYSSWPIPDVAATSWYFLPGGGLGTQPALGRGLVPRRPLPGRPGRATEDELHGFGRRDLGRRTRPTTGRRSSTASRSPTSAARCRRRSRWPAPARSTSG